jgi:serine O-acetyltransferase
MPARLEPAGHLRPRNCELGHIPGLVAPSADAPGQHNAGSPYRGEVDLAAYFFNPALEARLLFRTLSLVKSDFSAKAAWCYGAITPRTVTKALLADGAFAMIVYRLMQGARRARLLPLEMLFNKINVILGQCIIGRGAEFGPGFVLIHAQGVVINGAVRGGEHVYLEHQVTIGAERGDSPVLGDRVFIGAGAKVIGAVTLGSGCKVGANAVVTRDVPAHCTVVGIPAKVIKERNDDGEQQGVGASKDTCLPERG